MKNRLSLTLLALSFFAAAASASAASTVTPAATPAPDPQGKRPKFSSKIHIPVKAAAEVTSLPPVGYELVFSDEFNGEAINPEKWGFRLDSKMLSTQQPENISVKDGNLVIALRKESARGKDYTAGGVISHATFVYGYYEARFKTPPAEGWHTAFWSMKHSFAGEPRRQALLELDFCEQDGGDPHFFSFGIVNQRPDPKKGQTWNGGRWVIEDAPDTSAAFHVWACEFTPETTRFYFDGRLTKELSSSGFSHDDMNVWFSVIASKLKGDRWVDDTKLPNAVYCDYIRVYQHPQFREAEAAMRAASLRRPVVPDKKTTEKPKPNQALENLN
jgi:beta-glucanase (GH16 family)